MKVFIYAKKSAFLFVYLHSFLQSVAHFYGKQHRFVQEAAQGGAAK